MSYREEVMRTAAKHQDLLGLGAMGLAGEAGEVVDLVKKHIYHGAPFDKEKFIKELGDVRWYFEVLCQCVNVSMEEVEQRNIEKLHKRYPNGFNTEDSIKRVDTLPIGVPGAATSDASIGVLNGR